MNIGNITPAGLNAINNAIASNGVFLTLKKATMNLGSVPCPDGLEELPAPIIDGYINSVVYDQNTNGLLIQCVFDGEHPVVTYNSIGVYDVNDKLLFYSKQTIAQNFMRNSVVRFTFYIPLFSDVSEFANIRIMLPIYRVVHHVYEFPNEAMYWRAQHNLLTPFVQFTVFDKHGQVVQQSEYDSYVTPGFVHIAFKNAAKAGFIALQGEGHSLSIQQGESTEQLTNPYTEYQPEYDDDIPWITGTLIS